MILQNIEIIQVHMIDQCINKKYKYDVNNDDNNSTYVIIYIGQNK